MAELFGLLSFVILEIIAFATFAATSKESLLKFA